MWALSKPTSSFEAAQAEVLSEKLLGPQVRCLADMSLGWSEVRRSQAQEILEAFFHGNFGFLQTSCSKTKGICDKV